jgi:thiamine-monophosphate kinase
MRLDQIGEHEFIRRVTTAQTDDPAVIRGVGDDCAVIGTTPGVVQLLTVDMLVEGVDFLLDRIEPVQLGRRALAVNLSDIAAMGGTPRHALITLAAPGSYPVDLLDGVFAGIRDLAKQHSVSIIGGDMSSASELSVSITVLGEAPHDEVLYRDGARPGDSIVLVGTTGESGAGLNLLLNDHVIDPGLRNHLVSRHLDPLPRVEEGRWLAGCGLVNAMIDISDGLAADLGHICRASKVGALVFSDKIPITPELGSYVSATGANAENLLYHAGEDFALLLTAGSHHCDQMVDSFRHAFPSGPPINIVGRITEDGNVMIAREGGDTPLLSGGFDHFSGGTQ